MTAKRIENPTRAELETAERLLVGGEAAVVQFSEPCYSDDLLKAINSLAERFGRLLELRFYLHSGTAFDCAVLNRVPAVANLNIGLPQASNLAALAQLGCLEELAIGIDDLREEQLLGYPNLRALRALTLGETKTNAIELSCLGDFRHLESLRICGHTRGIAAVGSIASLRELALHGIGKQTRLDFLSKAVGLQRLSLLLGGRVSIAEIDVAGLRELEICRVRGLAELGDLSRFRVLETLVVDDQPKVESVALAQASPELRMVRLSNCRSLREVSGLDGLPKLDHLVIGATALDAQALLSLKLPPALRVCSLYTNKEREDKLIHAALAARGYRVHAT
jgi:hypothetical protein